MVIQEALHDFFKDRKDPRDRAGHFIRRSENVKSYSVSKSVDNIRKQQPKNIVMMD